MLATGEYFVCFTILDLHGGWLVGGLHDKGALDNANRSKASSLTQIISASLRTESASVFYL